MESSKHSVWFLDYIRQEMISTLQNKMKILNADVYLWLYVQNGDAALHIAALCHKSKVARLLVNAGCSCKLKNKVVLTLCKTWDVFDVGYV